ncbi:nucleotidyltransferase domain-containing protein [Candidatus Pacearchaeota archaeon]|nr:nucleotidyltransferase domain-containing protein [Candidatus Pacearchaeota archaeon]
MNLKILQLIKDKLKDLLKDKEILDIILFGSAIKGKFLPNDFDIAIITDKKLNIVIESFHISILKSRDFFINPPSLVHTLIREGYSLKHNKFLSEIYKFSNRTLFIYDLTSLNNSNKVKIVNALRGKNKEKGLVEQNNGKWLANQVFTVPLEYDEFFEKFFINFKVKFNKFYILIH